MHLAWSTIMNNKYQFSNIYTKAMWVFKKTGLEDKPETTTKQNDNMYLQEACLVGENSQIN